MRFRRRRNRPALNIPHENLQYDSNGNGQNFLLFNRHTTCSLNWNAPCFYLPSVLNSGNSLPPVNGNGVTHYVPKCITSVSQTDILYGDRVENFSSDCWLQNHLDQFGHDIDRQINPQILEDSELENDDSPIGSSAGSEVNSLSSSEDDAVNRLYFEHRHLFDVGHYQEFVEPPPYGLPDLPPSYEEVIASDQRVFLGSRESLDSTDSDIWSSAFEVLY